MPEFCVEEQGKFCGLWVLWAAHHPESRGEGINQMWDRRRRCWPSPARNVRLQLCQGYAESYWLQKCKTKFFGEKKPHKSMPSKLHFGCCGNPRLSRTGLCSAPHTGADVTAFTALCSLHAEHRECSLVFHRAFWEALLFVQLIWGLQLVVLHELRASMSWHSTFLSLQNMTAIQTQHSPSQGMPLTSSLLLKMGFWNKTKKCQTQMARSSIPFLVICSSGGTNNFPFSCCFLFFAI